MGFGPEAVALAYDKTVLKCHELKWAYCNGILKKWNEAGLHTVEEIQAGDRPAARRGDQQSPRAVSYTHLTAAVYAVGAAPASRWLAAGLAVSLGGFALGAGILAALFPTGLTKDLSDPSALIHEMCIRDRRWRQPFRPAAWGWTRCWCRTGGCSACCAGRCRICPSTPAPR